MRNPDNREILARIYRLVEKYEDPPKHNSIEEQGRYFKEVIKDCTEIHRSFLGNAFANELVLAALAAIEKRHKERNPDPLPEREPEQQEMLMRRG